MKGRHLCVRSNGKNEKKKSSNREQGGDCRPDY